MKKFLLSFTILFFCFLQVSLAQYYYNRAFSFNGTSYAVTRPGTQLNITSDFTVECWINPVNATSPSYQIILQKRSSGSIGYTMYTNLGRVAIRTGSSTRLVGNIGIPNNRWTHIAATYKASTNTFNVYVNGILDSSVVKTGAAPPPSPSDSLRFAEGSNSNFTGFMDEIRVWNVTRTTSEIATTMRMPLGEGDAYYSGLVGAWRGNSITAGSGLEEINGYTVYLRLGATMKNYSNQPGSYLAFNTGVNFSGASGNYIAAPHATTLNITGSFTLECWVNPVNVTTPPFQILVQKRLGSTSTGYTMYLNNGKVAVRTNSSTRLTGTTAIPNNVWSHVAGTYNTTTGVFTVYVNGVADGTTTVAGAAPVTNTDSLRIAEGFNSNFTGFMDEVRISNYVKTHDQILHGMNVSIDNSNEPSSGQTNIAYNFEGTLKDYTDNGPRGTFYGNTRFTQVVNSTTYTPAPTDRWDAGNFADGFRNKYDGRTFGAAPTTITDSVYIPQSVTISDVNLFIAITHPYANDIKVELRNPSNSTTRIIYPGGSANLGDHMITIFDDQADSTIGGGMGVFSAPWSPRVKPTNTLTPFNGQNTAGWWKLKITDIYPGADNGRLYSWGLQFNNQILVGIQNTIAETPVKYQLFQNYPNPFNPTTTIKFDLAKDGMTSIRIYDILGREVQTILSENLTVGSYELLFDGSSLSSGTYFYRIESLDFIETKKMMLVK